MVVKQRFGLDCISYLTDSAVRWGKPPIKKPARNGVDGDAAVAKLLSAIEQKQRETEQLMSELRRRMEQSA